MGTRRYSIMAWEVEVEKDKDTDKEVDAGGWVTLTGVALGNSSRNTEYCFDAYLSGEQILELYNKLRTTWTETEQK